MLDTIYYSVCSWFGRTTTPEDLFQSTIIKGRENQLAKKVLQTIADKPDFLSAEPKKCLQIRKELIATDLSTDHPLIQEIDAILARSGMKAKPSSCKIPLAALHVAPRFSTLVQTDASASQKPRLFVSSPYQTPEQIMDQLKGMAGELDEIELGSANNALLAMIADKFPALTTLRIKERLDSHLDIKEVDDVGLQSIGKLLQLKHFEWNFWDAIFISSKGLSELFDLPHLKEQLTTLNINHFNVGPQLLAELAEYKQLMALTIGCCGPKGFEKMLQSPSLQSSLEQLVIHSSTGWDTILSDQLLDALCGYKKLSELFFTSAPGAVSSAAMQKMLEAQSALKALSFDGVVFDDAMCEKIKAMVQLEKLDLADCSKMTDQGYRALAQGKAQLRQLSLSKAERLDNEKGSLKCIGKLPALESLSLEGSYLYEDLQSLISVKMQAQLRSLSLANFKILPTPQFRCLGQLRALNSLQIRKCPWFNDDVAKTVLEGTRNTLTTLQLDKVSLSDNATYFLSRLPNLRHLLLASCYAWTSEGYQRFVKSPTLQANLQTLCLDSFPLSDQGVVNFKNFSALRALLISNDYSLTDTTGVPLLISLAEKHDWQLMIADGETSYASAFKTAISDETHF